MAIKVFWGKQGPYAVADSAAEAAELMRLASFSGSRPLNKAGEPLSDEQAFSATVEKLGGDAKKFLTALAHYDGDIHSLELTKKANVGVRSLGGIMTSIVNAAVKNGLRPEDFLSSVQRKKGKNRERIFTPGKLLKKYYGP
ncbi:MAG: hypothetical protein ABSE93_10190 [Terriglobia bacterium]|jgi:hypothetical protein